MTSHFQSRHTSSSPESYIKRQQFEQAVPLAELNLGASANAIEMSASGRILATGSSSGEAELFEPRSGTRLQRFMCDSCIWGIDLSSDEMLLVTGDASGKVMVWSTADGACLLSVDCGSQVRSVEISENNAVLAAACQAGEGRVWTLAEGRDGANALQATLVRKVECGAAVYSIDLSADTKLVVTGDWSRKAKLWEVSSGALLCVFACAHNVYSVRLSNDNRLLCTGDAMSKVRHRMPAQFLSRPLHRHRAPSSHMQAKVWNTQTGEQICSMNCSGWVYCAAFSADNRLLLTGDQVRSGSMDRTFTRV